MLNRSTLKRAFGSSSSSNNNNNNNKTRKKKTRQKAKKDSNNDDTESFSWFDILSLLKKIILFKDEQGI